MTRGSAGSVAAAAEALRDWLSSQPARPHRPPPAPAVPGGTAAAVPAPPASAPPDAAAAAQDDSDRLGGAANHQAELARAAPLRLAHPDWLYHRMTVSGPTDPMAAFARAATGAGVIPWQLDFERLAEDLFHALVAPPPPHRRRLSLPGARILAGQLGDAVARRHALALARVGESRACPFDLHALLPVPAALLRRGPDDPAALAWLWTHWGTTEALRHVTRVSGAFADEPAAAAPGETVVRMTFWSADWTPWRALARLAEQWPALRFTVQPHYDAT